MEKSLLLTHSGTNDNRSFPHKPQIASKDKYMMIDEKDTNYPNLTDDEKIDIAAAKILKQFKRKRQI